MESNQHRQVCGPHWRHRSSRGKNPCRGSSSGAGPRNNRAWSGFCGRAIHGRSCAGCPPDGLSPGPRSSPWDSRPGPRHRGFPPEFRRALRLLFPSWSCPGSYHLAQGFSLSAFPALAFRKTSSCICFNSSFPMQEHSDVWTASIPPGGLHNPLARRQKGSFPMIGKYFSNGWKKRLKFSNDWKKFSAVFQ